MRCGHELGNERRMPSKPTYDGPALLHIGYPKTATSYLQEHVFSNSDFGMGLAGGTDNRSYLIKWLKTDDPYRFDPEAVAEEMEQLEAPVRKLGLVPVWSEETLLGNPMTRDYHGAWMLERLRALGKPFKILITIRRQQDMCLSAYREYLKFQRHSLRDFIGTGQEPMSFRPILDPEYLRYDVAAGRWSDAFQSENVLVLPQEQLRSQPEDYVQALASFAGVAAPPVPSPERRNVGLGGTALLFARVLNACFVRSPLSQSPSISERVMRKAYRVINKLSPRWLDRRIEARWRTEIDARYAGLFDDGNRQLAETMNQDLGKLGYSISAKRGGGMQNDGIDLS